jgi:hypothetical protein
MTIDQMRKALFQGGHKNIDSKSDYQVAAIYKRITNKEKK